MKLRYYTIATEMTIKAESFAEAEAKAHRVMSEAFNATGGEFPCEFNTLGIIKGELV